MSFQRTAGFLIFIFSLGIFIQSCGISIEKRRYRSGYSVTTGARYSAMKNNRAIGYVSPVKDNATNRLSVQPVNDRISESCDTLYFADGKVRIVVIEEVTDKAVFYRECDNASSPIYKLASSKLLRAIYSTGKVYTPPQPVITQKEDKKPVEKTENGKTVTDGKEKTVTEANTGEKTEEMPREKLPPNTKEPGGNIISFVAALLAVGFFVLGAALAWPFFIAAIAFAAIAITMGIFSLKKGRRGFGIAGIVIGAIIAVPAIILLFTNLIY